jgi:hypothetical protein
VERLRKAGCIVVGIGGAASSQALKDACNTFIPTDKLHKPVDTSPQPKPSKATKPPETPANKKVSSAKPVQPAKAEADAQLIKILIGVTI